MWPEKLLAWFDRHQRQMPWRSNPQPYYVWVSEVMLQQTQVDTVIPYFERFIQKFPTVHDLAAAPLDDVLKLWEGLGYYTRARNLHNAAKMISANGGELPASYEELQNLSGIGPYAGAAIASIAFNIPVPVVDGNVLRVFARFWGIFDDIRQTKVRLLLFNKLMPFIQNVSPSNFNQAIMELGALICTPKKPMCSFCPLQADCLAYQTGQVDLLPYKSKGKPVPYYDIAVGIVCRGDEVLIAKRKADQMLGGLWEFPGGKKEESETLEEAVKREILEETSLSVEVKELFCAVKHAYSHFKITLHAFRCIYTSGEPVPKSSDEIKWVKVTDLHLYPFPTANKKVLEQLVTSFSCTR